MRPWWTLVQVPLVRIFCLGDLAIFTWLKWSKRHSAEKQPLSCGVYVQSGTYTNQLRPPVRYISAQWTEGRLLDQNWMVWLRDADLNLGGECGYGSAVETPYYVHIMEMYNVPMICLPDDLMAADFIFYGHSTLTVAPSFILISHSPTLHAVQIKPHEFLRSSHCIQQRLHEKIQHYNFPITYLFMSCKFNDQQNLQNTPYILHTPRCKNLGYYKTFRKALGGACLWMQ
jgi:hypothetical protein